MLGKMFPLDRGSPHSDGGKYPIHSTAGARLTRLHGARLSLSRQLEGGGRLGQLHGRRSGAPRSGANLLVWGRYVHLEGSGRPGLERGEHDGGQCWQTGSEMHSSSPGPHPTSSCPRHRRKRGTGLSLRSSSPGAAAGLAQGRKEGRRWRACRRGERHATAGAGEGGRWGDEAAETAGIRWDWGRG